MSEGLFFATSDPCWLAGARQHPVRERSIDVIGTGVCVETIATELAAIGARNVSREYRHESDVLIATIDELRRVAIRSDDLTDLVTRCEGVSNEGFVLRAVGGRLYVTARGDRGLLYAYYRLLREPRVHPGLQVVESPARAIRMLNHWDNMFGSDRGGGKCRARLRRILPLLPGRSDY